jgi:hypothetical protein
VKEADDNNDLKRKKKNEVKKEGKRSYKDKEVETGEI